PQQKNHSVNKKLEPAAAEVVNQDQQHGEEEVEEKSERVRAGAAIMQSSLPQQPRGNYERNLFSEQGDGLSNIQSPGNQAADSDCQECALFHSLRISNRPMIK